MAQRQSWLKGAAGALFGLGAYAALSSHDAIVKVLGGTYSPVQIVFFGALLAFPFITIYLISDPTPRKLRPVHPGWLGARSIAATMSAVCAYFAFTTLPLSEAYAFIFSTPLLITLLAVPILGETIRLRRGIAVAVGLLGVLIVLNPGASSLGLGHLAAICAAFLAAFNAIVVRKISNDEHVVVMVLYPMLTNLAISAVILPFVYVDVQLVHFGMFAMVSALVLLGMSMLVVAYSRAPAIMVAPMQYSQILWGVLFGVLLFDEFPSWNTFVGAVVIVASGIYILKREAQPNVSRSTPVLSTKTRGGHPVSLRVGSMMRMREPKSTEHEAQK
ncbi:MAG: DMT family transporter [Pseudomonadota bacterium]